MDTVLHQMPKIKYYHNWSLDRFEHLFELRKNKISDALNVLAFHNETIICNSDGIAPRFISYEGVILVHQCHLPFVVCIFLQGGLQNIGYLWL